ncbi:hypothetical protein SBA3_2550015 [Candidatus Sulfopaludibacter sp. SbA3]|nr:hypothetical protein SBA3_2550015 [Candidatus Sulfopaludibacter sp. SbA3]
MAAMPRKTDSITQDCGACHYLRAMDEANRKVLTDLGITESKSR